jgi:hypothetical protein
MNTIKNPALKHACQELVDGMASYMAGDATEPDFDAGYSQAEIDQCAVILDTYFAALAAIDHPGNARQIMAATERAVLALNELNDRCDGCMIETDQREQLCDILIAAAKNAGLDSDDDITEAWREW